MPYQISKEKRAELRARQVQQAAEEEDGPWNQYAAPAADEPGPWDDFAGVTPTLGKNEAAGQDERSAAQAMNVIDTATFGFGDEILAAGSAADAFIRSGGDTKKATDAYDSEVKYARDLKERWRAQPDTTTGDVLSYGAGIVAGIPAGLPLFRGAQAVTKVLPVGKIGRNIAAMGATGAAASGAFQYGEAEGDPLERAQAVGAAGTMPLAAGALLGVAAGGAGAGVARGVQRVAQAFRGPEKQAARYLAEKLQQAGQSADDLAAEHGKAAASGKPVALGDVGPQGVRDAGASAARTPGPGRETAQGLLKPRQEGQVARVSDDVGQSVGGKPGTFTKSVEEITEARSREAKPLYEKALGSNAPVKSPKVVEIVNRPSGKAAMQRGLKMAQDEGIPESELVIRDGTGNIVGYSAKALHYMKMGLDDMIESATRSGDNSAARAFTIMKNELLGEMDRAIPGYADARKVFAGHSASKRALEQGRQAHNKHPDEIKSEMANMSQAEQDAYRRGFAQRVIEEVEKSPDAGNAARRIMGNTAKRERLRAVLGDEEFEKLMQRLGVEDQMYGSYVRANDNSLTAERVAADNDLPEYLMLQNPGLMNGLALSFQQMSVVPLIRAIGMSGVANLLRGISQRARGQIAKMLFSTDPNEVRQAITLIKKEYAAAQKFKLDQDAAIAASAGMENDTKIKAAAHIGAGANAAYQTLPPSPF